MLTSQQRICVVALKWLLGLFLAVGIVAIVVYGTGCSKTPATFTPLVAAPVSITDAQVFHDAEVWKSAASDRYWATTSDTHSMEPYYTAKSVPLMVRYSGQAVANGTVAVFNRGDTTHVMHVISDQTATDVYMSGVNNHQSDGWFPKDKIEGIVVGQYFRP